MENLENPFITHATEYDRWFESEKGGRIFLLELNCLRQVVDTTKGRWLEVGVGSGRFAHALGIEVGVDPSPAMVKISVEHGLKALTATGEHLPFDDASFDGVLLMCTICFLRDPEEVLRECRRILKDGGNLVIGFVPADSPWGVYHSIRGKLGHLFYSSAHFYVVEELIILAEKAGFTYQTENACVLPSPDGSSASDSMTKQTQRDESFAAVLFSK